MWENLGRGIHLTPHYNTRTREKYVNAANVTKRLIDLVQTLTPALYSSVNLGKPLNSSILQCKMRKMRPIYKSDARFKSDIVWFDAWLKTLAHTIHGCYDCCYYLQPSSLNCENNNVLH